jgi:hypothetical protein
VVSTYTGYSLENQISTAAVGNIVTPVVSISDASVVKPDQGSTFLEFTVSLDRPPAAPVSVAFTTTGGYATPGVDYQPASGTLTWAPGDNSSKTVRVPVLAGTQSRTDESVLVELGNPSGAVISKYRGEGAIVNSGPVYYTAPADGQPNRLVLVLDGATFSIYRNDNLELSGKSAQPAPIEIAGADGMENALTVKFGSPGNASAGGVSYQGGSSADTLTIDDTAALAVLYTVTGPDSGSFNVDGTQISYTGVESVADQFAPAVTGFPATSAEGTEIFLHASPLDPAPAYNYD